MFKLFIIGLLFVFIFHSNEICCAPISSGVEVDSSSGRQLDFPNDNEIPGNVVPNGNRPTFPSGPRGFRPQSEGILNRIVNFFRQMLGIGDQSRDGSGVDGGVGRPGGDGNAEGILGFIRRTFSGLINRIMGVIGGGGGSTPGSTPGGPADFPMRRPQFEPLKKN